MSEKEIVVSPEKEGWLKKRGARMHRWSNRYFALCGSTLVYKLKKESTSVRRSYDLMAGCILTEVEDDSKGGAKKGKQLYSFWIVWPQTDDDNKKNQIDEQPLSDDEEDRDNPKDFHNKPKDLKQIVRSEVITNRTKQKKAEEELEKHHNVDQNLSMGMKVAAVAVGGVVIGTLTLGIGLIPYMTVVGITAVASGAGVAYQYRRPSDARLILATESLSDALAWKAAIEDQIVKLEVTKSPRLPMAADPSVIASILGISTTGGGWFKVGQKEGIRIMQQGDANGYTPPPAPVMNLVNGSLMRAEGLFAPLFSASLLSPSRVLAMEDSGDNEGTPGMGVVCRKSQAVIAASPVNVFLALMNTADGEYFWPHTSASSLKVVQTLDDHADIIGVSVPLDRRDERCDLSFYDRLVGTVLEDVRMEGCLSRFWKLDDDGSYVIFYNSTSEGEYPPRSEDEKETKSYRSLPLKMDAVVSVAPRKDLINQEHICQMDVDVNECQVTMSIQLQLDDTAVTPADTGAETVAETTPSPWASVSECTRNAFMNSFVEQILDLREAFHLSRFDFDFDNELNGHNSNHHKALSDDGSKGGLKSNKGVRGGHAITSQPMQEAVRRGSGAGGGANSMAAAVRRGSGGGANMAAAGGGSPPHHTSASSSLSPGSGGTDGQHDASSSSRSQKMTNEAAHLRNHIASKEFELARLHKAMSKRKDSGGLNTTSGRHPSPLPPMNSKRATSPPPPPANKVIGSRSSAVMLNRPDRASSPGGASPGIGGGVGSGGSLSTTSPATSKASLAASLASKLEQDQLQHQLNRSYDLIDELNVLKGRYFRLTDMDYDKQQQNRRLMTNRRPSKTATGDGSGLPKGAASGAAGGANGEEINSANNNNIGSSGNNAHSANPSNKPVITAHIPMTPAAKSLRGIQHGRDDAPGGKSTATSASSANMSSLEFKNSSQKDSSATSGTATDTPPAAPLLNLRHPPYWTLISSEIKRKKCQRGVYCQLQSTERDILLYVLFFTVALVFSVLSHGYKFV